MAIFSTVADFLKEYREDTAEAQKMFDELTDASLKQSVADGHRDLGRVAWHIVQSGPETLKAAGFTVDESTLSQPVPQSASEIAAAYKRTSAQVADAVEAQATDALLAEHRDMWGMDWTVSKALACVLIHEAHHRGQMSVLMRQAGLTPHGVYGPHKEAWASMGIDPPAV